MAWGDSHSTCSPNQEVGDAAVVSRPVRVKWGHMPTQPSLGTLIEVRGLPEGTVKMSC